MPAEIENIQQTLRSALRREKAVWSEQCPSPETLLNWVEQEQAHPQAASLLEHYIICAFCRRTRASLCEIRALAAETQTAKVLHHDGSPAWTEPARVRLLPAKIRGWARELLTAGMLTPITTLRAPLERLDRLALTLNTAAVRSLQTPRALQPAFTAIRSLQPTLRWTPVEAAQEYVVVVARSREGMRPRPVWNGIADTVAPLTLPCEAGLEPGSMYLWQVIARTGEQEQASPAAAFLLLSEAMQRQAEALAQEAGDSPLARISVYEAYGLYEEALQEAEDWSRHNADADILRIRAKLLRRLQLSETGD